MGQLRPFACSACEYSGEATIGGTMAGFATDNPFPAMCACSQELVSVNMAEHPRTCPACGGSDFKLYGDQTRATTESRETLLAERIRRAREISALHPPSPALSEALDDSEHNRLPWNEGAHICPACVRYELRFAAGPSVLFD